MGHLFLLKYTITFLPKQGGPNVVNLYTKTTSNATKPRLSLKVEFEVQCDAIGNILLWSFPSASTNPLACYLTIQSPNSNSVLTSQQHVAGPQTCLPPSSHHLQMEGTLRTTKWEPPFFVGSYIYTLTKQIEDWGLMSADLLSIQMLWQKVKN